jgi:hypothetical protein
VFAAGIVLYNALTGTRLFDGSSVQTVLVDMFDRPIQAPSTMGRRPSAAYDAVVLKALERDPRRRFQSALQMRDALLWAAGEDLATAGDVSQLVSGSAGKALNGVMLEHLHNVATLRPKAAAPARPPAPTRRRRKRPMLIAAAIVTLAALAGTLGGVYASSTSGQKVTVSGPDSPVAMERPTRSPTPDMAAGERQEPEPMVAVSWPRPLVLAQSVAPVFVAAPAALDSAAELAAAARKQPKKKMCAKRRR